MNISKEQRDEILAAAQRVISSLQEHLQWATTQTINLNPRFCVALETEIGDIPLLKLVDDSGKYNFSGNCINTPQYSRVKAKKVVSMVNGDISDRKAYIISCQDLAKKIIETVPGQIQSQKELIEKVLKM